MAATVVRAQRALFDGPDVPRHDPAWRPTLRPLVGSDVEIDAETTGLNWRTDKVVGLAIRDAAGTAYLPIAHKRDPHLNINKAVASEWLRKELRGKVATNLNLRYDAHIIREDLGVDLRETCSKLQDVGHWAALLDDHRRHLSLEAISQDMLGRGKVKGLDPARMADYAPSQVAPYATEDVELTGLLKERMKPLLSFHGLQTVADLEARVLPAVIEMEMNAAPIDVELLQRWCRESEQDVLRRVYEVRRLTGLTINPDRSSDLERLFHKLNIPISQFTPTGKPSFGDEVMRAVSQSNEAVRLVYEAGRLMSLRSKYLLPYREALLPGGFLGYNLHQLRTDDGGTITGRFSSSHKNIQQVMAVEKQIKAFGSDRYLIRRLFTAPAGRLFLASDAKQIEYRIFAHYSASKHILEAYANNPETDFHAVVQEMLQVLSPGIGRKQVKNINFAKIYGAGIRKIAEMLGVKEDVAQGFVRAYDSAFPEVASLLARASRAAETRGWVKTILGRRSRFPQRERLHKALNSIIQGSAADINKLKLAELYETRHLTGFVMRLTVHDEVCGDVPDRHAMQLVSDVLARQSVELRVPILWDTKVGANWAECK